MKKVKLEVETLHVDSFDVSTEPAAPRGTVQGHSEYDTYWCTAPSSVGPNKCLPYPWSWNSCGPV